MLRNVVVSCSPYMSRVLNPTRGLSEKKAALLRTRMAGVGACAGAVYGIATARSCDDTTLNGLGGAMIGGVGGATLPYSLALLPLYGLASARSRVLAQRREREEMLRDIAKYEAENERLRQELRQLRVKSLATHRLYARKDEDAVE